MDRRVTFSLLQPGSDKMKARLDRNIAQNGVSDRGSHFLFAVLLDKVA